MNKTYNLVWNAIQQAWVVTSELGKARKKVKNLKTVSTIAAFGIAILCSTAVYADPAPRALPSLNNIASGTATLATATGSLTVNQTSDKLIANWNSFDVGVNSKVTFNQPNTSSIALNRISGAAPSEIFGRVLANGQLILVNPTGLTFGAASQVNAASVIASTLDITDANFLADTLQFDRGTSTGSINNQGTLLANEGNTYVFASNINNSGTIRAQGGNIIIANGNRLTVNNTAGTATLNQVSGIAGVISSTGILRGDRLTTSDKGKIYLIGDRARTGSVVNLAGELTSTGNDIKGKTINVTGDTVVNASTNLNAINNININGALSVSGNNRLISLTHGTAGTDGLSFGNSGKISMPGSSIRYRVNNNYYTLIKTLAELQAIGNNSTTLAGQYALAVDIDASSTASNDFNPIGSSGTTGFSGLLDGLGNSINNLTINKPTTDEVGLIGFNQFGSLKNIVLTNAAVTGQNYVGGLIGRNGLENGPIGNNVISGNQIFGSITGRRHVGSLVGMHNLYNASSTVIFNNISNAKIIGIEYVGGLVGRADVYNNSTFSMADNHVMGDIQALITTGSKGFIGGFIGKLYNQYRSNSSILSNSSDGNISFSYATINMSGGIGDIQNYDSSLNISKNITEGNIITTTNSVGTGGLIGILNNQASSSNSSPVTIDSNISRNNIITGSYAGGLIGQIYGYYQTSLTNNAATGSISAGNSTGANYVGGLIGFANMISGANNHAVGDVTGTSYVGGLIGINNLSSITNSYATGSVSGTNHVGGLIGMLHNTNISMSYATGNVIGDINSSNIGGLIGSLTTQDGNLWFENNYAASSVSGKNYLGGLIGRVIVGKLSTININNSFAKTTVSATGDYVGGLIGYSNAGNHNLYLSNTYAVGQLTGGINYKGGLIGYAEDSSGNSYLSNSYWDKSMSSLNNAIGYAALNQPINNLTGLTTSETLQQASYSGWDISNSLSSNSIWYINENISSPVLRSFINQ